VKEMIQDPRVLSLAPSDRWYYLAFITQLEEVKERGLEAVLGLSPEEHYRWRERVAAAGLYPRSFT
tara:strand:+ start:75326 stop:75523 length:198 start_codon:yes stop_codon:yes gene_type:complete